MQFIYRRKAFIYLIDIYVVRILLIDKTYKH